MVKAKILAIGKETRGYDDRNGQHHTMRKVILGREADNYLGFYPMSFERKNKDGNPYETLAPEYDMRLFGSYDPKVGDIVNIEYGPNNRIVSITKAAN